MRFSANSIDELKLELERALSAPDQPRPVYACTTANLPPPASFPNSVVYNSTLNMLVYSDGKSWYRADTGAAV
jgi:hypothetical protein